MKNKCNMKGYLNMRFKHLILRCQCEVSKSAFTGVHDNSIYIRQLQFLQSYLRRAFFNNMEKELIETFSVSLKRVNWIPLREKDTTKKQEGRVEKLLAKRTKLKLKLKIRYSSSSFTFYYSSPSLT